jgi:uncharacterized membrane protein YbhN (UPF0104 family)
VLWNGPRTVAGRAAQAIRNRIRKGRPPLTGLPERLLRERDIVVRVLGKEWWKALILASGRWLLDYLTLVAAVYAVGARPHISLVLLAFCAAQLLAGVGGGAAVVATLAYRLVSFWLPIPAGAIAAVVHRRRYGSAEVAPAPPTPMPAPGAASPDPLVGRSPPTSR